MPRFTLRDNESSSLLQAQLPLLSPEVGLCRPSTLCMVVHNGGLYATDSA